MTDNGLKCHKCKAKIFTWDKKVVVLNLFHYHEKCYKLSPGAVAGDAMITTAGGDK